MNQYLNISSYKPLSGCTYCKLPKELSHPMKGLINIQNNDKKCFLWCHVRYLNSKDVKLSRITKEDQKIIKSLNYDGIEFPVSRKDFLKISLMNKININVFSYEDKIIYHIYLSDQSFNDVLDLLLINNHYALIKDFNRLMFNKTKSKNKKWFCKSCSQCFSNEKVLLEHGKDCLIVNGRQRIKLKKGFIEFNNFNKMIPSLFKIYADFERLLKKVDCGINNDCFSYTTKYQDHVPCSFAYKLVCIDDKLSKDIALYRGKNAVFKFIQSIFNEYSYCKSIIKKHFNKKLIMSVEEGEKFEKTEICWICNKLIENDNKVRDHCHITGKYRGAAHSNCELHCNTNVIPNGLEKYMSFTLGKNIIFIDSMLFLNSSLDKLVKNSKDFKYLSKVFEGEELQLVKKKGIYPYKYMNSFKRFKENCLPEKD